MIHNTDTALLSLKLTLMLSLILVPVPEVSGAAMASLMAYALALVVTPMFYRYIVQARGRELFLPRSADAAHYSALRRLPAAAPPDPEAAIVSEWGGRSTSSHVETTTPAEATMQAGLMSPYTNLG